MEFLGESISPVDLVTFMDTYGRYFTHYNGVDGIMGRNTPVNPGLTANLDVQYIMSLGETSHPGLYIGFYTDTPEIIASNYVLCTPKAIISYHIYGEFL